MTDNYMRLHVEVSLLDILCIINHIICETELEQPCLQNSTHVLYVTEHK